MAYLWIRTKNIKENIVDNFEELQRKKEYLELERQISKLERDKKINKVFNFLPWKVLIPFGLFGLLLLLAGIDKKDIGPIILGILILIPLALKFFSRK